MSKYDLSSYEENGYLLRKKEIDTNVIDKLKLEITEVFRNQILCQGLEWDMDESGLPSFKSLCEFFKKDKEKYLNTIRILNRLPSIYRMACNSNITQSCVEIGLQSPVPSARPNLSVMHKETSESEANWLFPIHQDWRSVQGSLNMVVIWIPLIDISENLGPLHVVPSSHKNGLYPVKKDNWYMSIENSVFADKDFISLEMTAGDVLYFSGFLVHKSGLLRTQKHRWSLQLRFNDLSESCYMKRGYPLPYSSERPVRDYINSLDGISEDSLRWRFEA